MPIVWPKRRKLSGDEDERPPLASPWKTSPTVSFQRHDPEETIPGLELQMREVAIQDTYPFEETLQIIAEPLLLFLGSSSRGTMALAFSGRFPLTCVRVGATRVVQSSLSHRAAVLEAAQKWHEHEEDLLEMLWDWERCLRALAKGCAAADDERPLSSVFEAFSKQLNIAAQTRSKRSSVAWRKAFHDTPAGCNLM